MEPVNVRIVDQVRNRIVSKARVFLVLQERSPMEMACVFLVRSGRILLMSARFNATDADAEKNLMEL